MTSKSDFDPNCAAASDSGLFGLPYPAEESLLHLIPVPWEVTTSYGDGASRGPEAILQSSHQVDLFDLETGEAYRNGYFMHPISAEVLSWNQEFKAKAKKALQGEADGMPHTQITALKNEINAASDRLNEWVYQQAKKILNEERIAAVIGGDHSTPFGLLRALTEHFDGAFGILHIDAHADLRDTYQDYNHSHASIMHNVVEKLKPKALVQVGIRDFSAGEYEYIKSTPTITTFFDSVVKRRQHRGEPWQSICDDIVGRLPDLVYVSFDIDGLSPDLCPNTGTPVPGGLRFEEAQTLFATIAESGRRIVGFDLNEVAAPEGRESEWDGNVGARLLFKLCGWTMISNGLGKRD